MTENSFTDPTSDMETRKQLSFCEVHIALENINKITTQTSFIVRLDSLIQSTEDPQLSKEASNLLEKVKDLTPVEFGKFKQDVLLGKILYPHDYTI